MDRKIIVSLTGGLGNQLFQIANGLKIAGEDDLWIEHNLGAPRLNKEGIPELFSFKLPLNIKVKEVANPYHLLKKSWGYGLRSGALPRGIESNLHFRRLVNSSISILLIPYLKAYCHVDTARGLGHSPTNAEVNSQFIIGYHQTYMSLRNSKVRNLMMGLTPTIVSDELLELKNFAQQESPLVVHLRLADYKTESKFGVPNPSYYSDAFKLMKKNDLQGRVWIFSDELELAKKLLPSEILVGARLIPVVDNSSASTLELMRHGRNYIIGNSTFSWWGAALSYNPDAKVVAPDPWFKDLPEPNNLISPEWLRIHARLMDV